MAKAAAGGELRLSTPVKALPGIGAKRAARFARLEIVTVSDLLRHLPMRYEQEAAEDTIAALPAGGIGAARGMVTGARWVPSSGGRVRGRFEAIVKDDTGTLNVVWFNASYLRQAIHPGMTVRVQGKVKSFDGYPQMVNPKWENLAAPDEEPAKAENLRPIYPATEDLPSAAIERVIGEVIPSLLPHLADPLPAELTAHHNMPGLADAFRMAHLPAHVDEARAARRRLAYNELLLLQLGIALKRHYNQCVLTAAPLHWSEAIDEHILARFPFDLTASQTSVIQEIVTDLKKTNPMNRLLQGDVGAGKTVVALYAMLMAVANRKQAALMAPTELLAEQHMLSISAMLEGANVKAALLTGSLRAAERNALLADVEAGAVDVMIGTQALLTESVRFQDLAVVVIDEQHRFGVLQRAVLRSRGGLVEEEEGTEARRHEGTEEAAGEVPHCLVMTATPIPRTLSLTVFGDLDVSIIKGLPPGRKPIATRTMPPERADEVYGYMVERLARGEQAYVVLPAIEDDGRDANGYLKNVRDHVAMLAERFCEGYTVAAVHGRLKRDERETIMDRFRRGEVDVLVATTVIEVGVDVPNASVMIVEHAERFGLAQLHQLRGRVGRGGDGRQALCVFITDPTTDDGQQRMEAIAGTTDGFEIAEADLKIRGMGDFFGTRQSGAPPLRTAQIPQDMDLLKLARHDAEQIVAADPRLAEADNDLLRQVLLQQYGETLGLIDVG